MKRYIVSILVLAALAGCTSMPITAGGGQEKPDVVAVEGPTCTAGGQPCSAGDLTRYDTATIRMSVVNNGDTPIFLRLDGKSTKQSNWYGRNLLVSTCNEQITDITGYEVRRSGNGELTTWSHQAGFNNGKPSYAGGIPGQVKVRGGQQLAVEWDVEIIGDKATVSDLGYTCPLSFELDFKQHLRTSRQIQLRSSPDVPEVASLGTTTTSRRPVRLRIDAPRSFTVQGDRRLVSRAYLQNEGKGEVQDGSISISPAKGGLYSKKNCGDGSNLRMYGRGKRGGQSYRQVCSKDPSGVLGSKTSAITEAVFTASYRYKMPLNDVRIPVRPLEGQQ